MCAYAYTELQIGYSDLAWMGLYRDISPRFDRQNHGPLWGIDGRCKDINPIPDENWCRNEAIYCFVVPICYWGWVVLTVWFLWDFCLVVQSQFVEYDFDNKFQVIVAQYLATPSNHYLNQCWLVLVHIRAIS